MIRRGTRVMVRRGNVVGTVLGAAMSSGVLVEHVEPGLKVKVISQYPRSKLRRVLKEKKP